MNGVRNVASPDINTEDFSAAVDFLSNEKMYADPDRNTGILGICGWGGITAQCGGHGYAHQGWRWFRPMYDMSRVMANGYFDYDKDEVHQERAYGKPQGTQYSAHRGLPHGYVQAGGGVVDLLPADAPQFVKDYYAYYKTKRGYHPRSLNSNEGCQLTTALSFMNMPLLTHADEIESAVLVIHGGAHSRYFGEDAQEAQRR